MEHIIINPLPPEPVTAPQIPRRSFRQLNWRRIRWWFGWFVGLLVFAVSAFLLSPTLLPPDYAKMSLLAFPMVLVSFFGLIAGGILLAMSFSHALVFLLLALKLPARKVCVGAAVVLLTLNAGLLGWLIVKLLIIALAGNSTP